VHKIALPVILALSLSAALQLPNPAQQGSDWARLDDAGTAAYQKGNFAEAEKSFLDAQKASESFPAGDLRLARTLNNLALVYDAENKDKESEELYKKSLALKQAAEKPDFLSINATINNLSSLYKKQKRFADAIDQYRQALANAEKGFGPDSTHVAACLNNLSGALSVLNKYSEAEPLLRRSLAII
jgi:tetratricopeptide (TPR) repeat protein